MTFYARIFCESDVTKSEMTEILRDVLSGKTQLDSDLSFDVPGPGQFFSNKITVIDVKAFHEENIRLNLSSYDYVSKTSPDFNKVCALGDRAMATQTSAQAIPPCGYFIVNSADVTYGLIPLDRPMVELDRQLEGGSYEDLAFGQTNFQTNDIFFALDVVEIKNEDVLTCLPDIPGGYMPTRNVLCDAIIRDSPSLAYAASSPHINPYLGPFGTAGAFQLEFSDFYINMPYSEKATNRISGWVVLRKMKF